jgi:uncharacterized membrane protein
VQEEPSERRRVRKLDPSRRQTRALILGTPEELGESSLVPAAFAIAAAALYATLPAKYLSGSSGALDTIRWVVAGLTVVLIVPLALTAPKRHIVHSPRRRTVAMVVVAVITAANTASIVLLVHFIVNGRASNGHELILAAVRIWCTNVIVFALWFWQLDSGGPLARRHRERHEMDFLFPQEASPMLTSGSWQPQFLDYLYLSFTNSTAFSPTDTMPLSRWAKMLMLVESGASLLLLVMVAARAVNILK